MRIRRLLTQGLAWRPRRAALTTLPILAACGLAAPVLAGGALAASTEKPADVSEAIRQAAAEMAPADATITVGPVLGARYMSACTRPLAVSIIGTEPYEQATAHCGAPSWTLYVTVTVDARMAVVVVTQPVAAGDTLQSSNLGLREEPVSLYAGRQVYYHVEAAVGATAILSMPVGTILTQSNMEQPLIVRAGQSITVDAISGGVDIAITGTAEQSGRIGDTIMIANPSSGRRFPATVTRAGAVVQLGP